jgi:hypothetical protein
MVLPIQVRYSSHSAALRLNLPQNSARPMPADLTKVATTASRTTFKSVVTLIRVVLARSHMDGALVDGESSFLHGFRQGRMRVAGAGQILRRAAELHEHGRLCDHLTRVRRDDMHAEHEICCVGANRAQMGEGGPSCSQHGRIGASQLLGRTSIPIAEKRLERPLSQPLCNRQTQRNEVGDGGDAKEGRVGVGGISWNVPQLASLASP